MAEKDVKKEETPAPQKSEEVSGPVPVSALPPEAQEQVKQSLEQQADKAPSASPPQDDHTVQAISQALASIGASSLVPVIVHAVKTGVCALVDDMSVGIKTVDLGAASAVVNLLAGNVAAALKAWIINFNYPRPGPSPYGPPQPQPGPYYPPQPGPAPQPYYPPQPQPGPAPYYPPQPQPGPAPAPYYPPAPPQPTPQPGPTPPRPPGLDINVR